MSIKTNPCMKKMFAFPFFSLILEKKVGKGRDAQDN